MLNLKFSKYMSPEGGGSIRLNNLCECITFKNNDKSFSFTFQHSVYIHRMNISSNSFNSICPYKLCIK